MKNWFTQLLGLCSLVLVVSACEKDETKVTVTPSNSPTLSLSRNTVVLEQANEAQPALTYTWTPVSSFAWSNTSNTYNPAVTYTLEIDKQGNNFAAPASVNAGTASPSTVTVADLNAALNGLSLAPRVATPLEVRLKANYAANAPLYSPVLPFTASAYKVCLPPNSDVWGLVGPAADGWPGDPPATDAIMTYDCDTKTYKITRTLTAGEFKFRKNRGWAINFGDDGADGTLDSGGKNIAVATTGVYTVTLDLNTMKYTVTK